MDARAEYSDSNRVWLIISVSSSIVLTSMLVVLATLYRRGIICRSDRRRSSHVRPWEWDSRRSSRRSSVYDHRHWTRAPAPRPSYAPPPPYDVWLVSMQAGAESDKPASGEQDTGLGVPVAAGPSASMVSAEGLPVEVVSEASEPFVVISPEVVPPTVVPEAVIPTEVVPVVSRPPEVVPTAVMQLEVIPEAVIPAEVMEAPAAVIPAEVMEAPAAVIPAEAMEAPAAVIPAEVMAAPAAVIPVPEATIAAEIPTSVEGICSATVSGLSSPTVRPADAIVTPSRGVDIQ